MVTIATIAHTLTWAPVRLIVAHISAPKRNTAKKIAPHSNRLRLTSNLNVFALMERRVRTYSSRRSRGISHSDHSFFAIATARDGISGVTTERACLNVQRAATSNTSPPTTMVDETIRRAPADSPSIRHPAKAASNTLDSRSAVT